MDAQCHNTGAETERAEEMPCDMGDGLHLHGDKPVLDTPPCKKKAKMMGYF